MFLHPVDARLPAGPVNQSLREVKDLWLPPIIRLARPGAFRKYVTVISNSNPGSVRLTIAGEVEPKPKTIEDDYRYAMGPMRLKSNHLAFGNLKNTETTEKQLEVINTSDENVEDCI